MSVFSFGKGSMVKSVALGALIAIIVMLLLTIVISAVILMIPTVPKDYLQYIMLIADAVGIFAGAYIAAASAGSKGLITGLICGLAVFIVITTAGLMTGGEFSVLSAIRLFVLSAFGVFGGIKGVNRKERVSIR